MSIAGMMVAATTAADMKPTDTPRGDIVQTTSAVALSAPALVA